jgi:ketosteroid isomerase-like protein
MSEENVEIVHRVVEALNRRDFDDAARALHEDAVFHQVGGFAGLVGENLDGREEIFRFVPDVVETLGAQIAIETTLDAGERVVIIATAEGIAEASGAPTKIRFGQVWSFRDARVSQVDGYWEPMEALKAAGLRE